MSSSSIKTHHADQVLSLNSSGSRASEIVTSWRRCLEDYGLDPERKDPIHILSGSELKEVFEPIENLLSIAERPLIDLSRQVAPAGYIVMLTDAQGVVVRTKAIGDTEPFGKWGLATGAMWSEQYEGTNGVGVCLKEQRPVTVHRDEHFRSSYVSLTCTVAPIFDPMGNLVGGLDVSSSDLQANEQVILFAQAAANRTAARLEAALFRHLYRECWIATIGESNSDSALIAFNKERQLLGANRFARQLLSLNDDQIRRGIEIVEERFRGFPIGERPSIIQIGNQRVLPLQQVSTLEFPAFKFPHSAASSSLTFFTGTSQVSDAVRRAIASFRVGIPVLISGELGVGKEGFARALHATAMELQDDFVRIDCADLTERLTKGSRDEAEMKSPSVCLLSKLSTVKSGTVFLDNLTELPPDAQAALVDWINNSGQGRSASADRKCRVRIVSACRSDLDERLADCAFRSDLYYLLRGATVRLSPLRERSDRLELIARILRDIDPRVRLSDEALSLLLEHSWPGNIRELKCSLLVAVASCVEGVITPRDIDLDELKERAPKQPLAPPAHISLESAEREVILQQLEMHNFDVTKAARALGISRATLYRKIKYYNVSKIIGARAP